MSARQSSGTSSTTDSDEADEKALKLPEYRALSSYIGTAVRNADGEVVGTVHDFLVNNDGSLAGILLNTGGILGVGKKTVMVPFAECAIIPSFETASIIMPNLHSGEILVAPTYQFPGGTTLERTVNYASILGHAAITKVRVFSEKAANKTIEYRKRAVTTGAKAPQQDADQATKRDSS